MNYNPEVVREVNEYLKECNIAFLRFALYEWDGEQVMDEGFCDIDYVVDSPEGVLWGNCTDEEKEQVKDALLDILQENLFTLAEGFPIDGGPGVYEYYVRPNQIVKVGEFYLTTHFESLKAGPINVELEG